jgi:uncharacterized protein YfaS (alpha-2-macroglobulin family)
MPRIRPRESRVNRARALLLAFAFLLAGCGRPGEQEALAPEEARARWQDHLVEYTQGWVGAEQVLLLRFSHPVVDDAQLNTPLDGIVTIEPAQEAVAVFTAPDTMEVRHPERFPQGGTLEVTLGPGKLKNVPPDLPPLRWTVQVLEQGLSLRELGLLAQPDERHLMWLEGRLETSDAAENAAVEKVLRATQGEQARPIVWKHVDARQHAFTVQGIERTASPGQLRITWDATPIGVDSKGEREVQIPALEVFKLTSMQAMAVSDPHVELRFSEPLDATANLDGAVTINGRNARVQVDGSILRAYSDERLSGTINVHVAQVVRAAQGSTLSEAIDRELEFAGELPAVRFAEKGHILPDAGLVTIPFEAVAVKAVRVRAFEVFANNIGQYLQDQGLDYSDERYLSDSRHYDVGRYLWQKTITLPTVPMAGWERFDLDVDELVRNKKGSLIRLDLQILPQDSAYACDTAPDSVPEKPIEKRSYDADFDGEGSVPWQLRRYYESAGYYEWDERNNPCHASYYEYGASTAVSQMFFASSIGLLAKQGADRQLHVLATDLRSAKPLGGASITAFNYQQQRIGSGSTDTGGLVTLDVEGVPFTIRAEKDGDTAWLKVARNEALPTSQFDTGGTEPQAGLKGFLYGERDIWRPGDAIFLTFILQDRNDRLPADYPVTLEFFDPRGNKQRSITSTTPVNGFYAFELGTEESAPTGNWRAIVKIGDEYFDRIIKVENIAPNHLRMDLDLPADGLRFDAMPRKTTLSAQWLNGATAAALKADVQVRLAAAKTTFAGFEGFRFDDAARSYTQEPVTVFEGALDDAGRAEFDLSISPSEPPPGVLNATFTQRVFEPGGQFSTQYRRTAFYPFATWVGLHAPAGDTGSHGALDKDAKHAFDLLSIDSERQPVAGRNLQVTLYEIEWRWWWDEDGEDFARYVSDQVHRPRQTQTLKTDAEGRATWTMDGTALDWGRYLVRVCDADESGARQHCASQDIYLGWGYGSAAGRDAATRMSIAADRDGYAVGDTASVQLPPGPDREVLVSVENGDRVLKRYWQAVKEGADNFTLPITPDMTPNVYVYVAQLQPHQGRDNDLPIRQYGIVPLLVTDPGTHLVPILDVPEKVRPETTLTVKVAEQKGRAMTYTLAIVDEGLLGITDYHAPDPHETFYRREALGVRTWDLFDQVVGAYGAALNRLLALGGSDVLPKRDSSRERRYPPVVKFLGPFVLEPGATVSHDVQLPPYMGAVRVMVVAGDARAYGSAEKTVTVTQPLNVLATLPRVLGPGEELDVPVTVFVAEGLRGAARVTLQPDAIATVLQDSADVTFDADGEKTARLRIKVNEQTGMATFRVAAALGAERASETIHVPVRSANLPETRVERHQLAPGETWEPASEPFGLLGTNSTLLTVSRAPDMDLDRRLDYLLRYPHGCIEQTVSAVFPQLYLPKLVDLDATQAGALQDHVDTAIARLGSFQTESGGFAYWPYEDDVAPWASDYAGHFLLEAKRNGYAVPDALLHKWLSYQQRHVRAFTDTEGHRVSDQAYGLYTLALANKADTGAMNRLRDTLSRESRGRLAVARWMLALAYAEGGLSDVASELLRDAGEVALPTEFDPWYYGSALRDNAILLLLQHRLGRDAPAWMLGERIAKELSADRRYDTHATAWALLALAQTFGDAALGESRFALREAGGAEWKSLGTPRVVYRQELAEYKANEYGVRNDSAVPLHVTLTQRGIPANAEEIATQNVLLLDVRFTDTSGKPLAVHSLPQGEDFVAEVTVRNGGIRPLDNLALSQVVPSGWQIRNARLEGADDNVALDYQDLRDDRVLSYFELNAAGRDSLPWWWDDPERSRSDTVTLRLVLNASFAGRFYLPGWRAEAMYETDVLASVAGQWVEVVPR